MVEAFRLFTVACIGFGVVIGAGGFACVSCVASHYAIRVERKP